MIDSMNASIFSQLPKDSRAFYRVETKPVSASTNNDIREAAVHDAPEGLVIIADQQTEGRGRLRRPFFSPNGTGLYMSVLLRPKARAADSVRITAAAAVAVAEAIEAVSDRRAWIKWVNDIFLNDKKVCGILAESALTQDGSLRYVALGIGVNVTAPPEGFPPEIAEIACAVFKQEAPENARARLAAEILERLYRYYQRNMGREFLEAYRSRSLLIGNPVRVILGENTFEATALSIDDDCRLIVEADGKTLPLCAGEVSIRPIGLPGFSK